MFLTLLAATVPTEVAAAALVIVAVGFLLYFARGWIDGRIGV